MMNALFKEKSHLAFLALVFAMVLWASSFIALKLAFQAYDPLVVIFGRMLIASLCFLLFVKKTPHLSKYQQGDYKLLFGMVLFEPCLYFLFEANAVVLTTASQAGMITAMLPILVMGSAAIFLREKIKTRAWLGGMLAVAGVCWLTSLSTPSEHAKNPILGNILEIFAMVCAAGYTISLKKLTKRYSPFFLTALQAFAGCFFYFPILFLPSTTWPEQFSLTPFLAILYLGSVITLGAYGSYNFGLKYIPANRAASFVNLIPIFSVILGYLVLGETISISQTLAGLLIITGVYLTQS